MGILGQKSVTAVNGVDVGDFRRADDSVDAKVALVAGCFADANGFVGQLDVHRVGVHLRIHGHGADIQLFAGTNDANGDFAPIRYQNLLKHLALLLPTTGQCVPGSCSAGLRRFTVES